MVPQSEYSYSILYFKYTLRDVGNCLGLEPETVANVSFVQQHGRCPQPASIISETFSSCGVEGVQFLPAGVDWQPPEDLNAGWWDRRLQKILTMSAGSLGHVSYHQATVY